MKDKILWICPSKNRPKKLEQTILSWIDKSENLSDLLVVKDNDDESYEELIKKYPNVIWENCTPLVGSFLHGVNQMAVKYADDYRYLGFLEDDILFETKGYESKFIQKLNELGQTGIVHAKDGFVDHKFHLLTIPVMNSFIVKRLGFMSPPSLKSLCADYFWRVLAEHLKTFYKFEDVLIKHNHYVVTKEKRDATSKVVDANYKEDRKSFYKYYERNFQSDMKKLEC